MVVSWSWPAGLFYVVVCARVVFPFFIMCTVICFRFYFFVHLFFLCLVNLLFAFCTGTLEITWCAQHGVQACDY